MPAAHGGARRTPAGRKSGRKGASIVAQQESYIYATGVGREIMQLHDGEISSLHPMEHARAHLVALGVDHLVIVEQVPVGRSEASR